MIKFGRIKKGYVVVKLKGGGSSGLPQSLKHKEVYLMSEEINGGIQWTCGTPESVFSRVPLKYLPASCRGDVGSIYYRTRS